MFKILINDIKFIVWSKSEPFLRKLILNKKGVGARLCQAKYVLFSELIPFSRKKQMPEAIMLSMPLYHNFYHWMVEILPRLSILEKAKKDLSYLPIAMPKQHPKFVAKSLVCLKLIDRILFIDNGVARFSKLHLLTKISQQNTPSPIAVEWLRKIFLKNADKYEANLCIS